MSRKELEDEIINLKTINATQSQKIEDYEQKIYELKRQLSTAKAMEEHLSSEIESLQKIDKTQNDEYLKKISTLEEEIHNIKQLNADNVQYYEKELQNKDLEIENILENLKLKPESNIQNNTEEINKFTDEICDLKIKIEELTQQLLECENKYQEMSFKNASLENHITELNSQLEELRDCLVVKKEELEENKELARNLQDDMIIMQMELDKFKSLPTETAAKGNSLFAEVDDNRVKVQKTLETMKKKYLEMRTQYSSKCHELQKLHMEYAALIKVIETKNDVSDDKSELEQAYERHFKILNDNIVHLENEIKLQKHTYSTLISKDWKCAQEMISVSREEVQNLLKKLNTESLGLVTSEANHYKTKRELKKWQAEAMQLRAQILTLNQTIEDLKVLKSPPPAFKEPAVLKKSCLKKDTGAIFSPVEDWELTEEKSADLSLIIPKLHFDKQLLDTNSSKCDSITDYSIFDIDVKKSNKESLIDDMKSTNSDENSELNCGNTSVKNNFADYSIFDCIKSNKESLMDETDALVRTSEQENKENESCLNNTTDTLTSNLKKVSFESSILEPQEIKKIGGRKIIKAQPIHIPSIKRN